MWKEWSSTIERKVIMSLLSDQQILKLCAEQQMITPFESKLIRQLEVPKLNGDHFIRKCLSYGVSSFGYDCTLADRNFKVFSPVQGTEIDPKNFDLNSLVDAPIRAALDGSKYYLLPPHSYALGETVETFNMPRKVTGICLGKSTMARCGLVLNTTPLEAQWTGVLVLEMYNASNLPLRVYALEGIGQILFFEGNEEPNCSYADRGGKYQGQQGLTTAKV